MAEEYYPADDNSGGNGIIQNPIQPFIPSEDQQATYQRQQDEYQRRLEDYRNQQVDYVKQQDAYQKRQQDQLLQDTQPNDTIGFWPHALAVMAAVNGDFRPAVNLLEQKRQTDLAKFMDRPMREFNHLVNAGRYQEANDLLDNIVSKVGPRAKEMVPYFQKARETLNQRELETQHLQGTVTMLKGIIPEDDPDYGAVKQADQLVKNGGRLSQAYGEMLLKPIMNKHLQIINNQLVRVSQLSGQTQTQPLPTPFDPASIKGFPTQKLQSMFDTTEDQISNILNGLHYTNNQGEKQTPSAQDIATVRHEVAKAQGQQAQLTVGQGLSQGQAAVNQYQAQGISPFDIAAGNVTPQQAQAGLLGQQKQAVDIAQKTDLAIAETNPLYLKGKGQVAINVTPGSQGFGTEVPATSLASIREAGGNLAIVSDNVHKDKILPSLQALDHLDSVKDMFALLGQQPQDSTLGYIAEVINKRFGQLTGIALKPEDTAAKAAQAIANRAMEALAGTGAVPESAMKTLKSMATGVTSDPAGAAMAVQMLREKAQRELGYYIDRSRVQAQSDIKGAGLDTDWYPVAQKYGVNPMLAQAVLHAEGSKDEHISQKGALTRWQLMPDTANYYLQKSGKTLADLTNPATRREVSNEVAMQHFADLQAKYPNRIDQQLAVYNGGPKALKPDGTIDPSWRVQQPNGKGKRTIDYVLEAMNWAKSQQDKAKSYSYTNVGR